MGNLACTSSSAESEQLPSGAPSWGLSASEGAGLDEVGFNDLPIQGPEGQGLGLVHLFRTASEEAAEAALAAGGKQKQKGSFFGLKKKKKAIPAAPVPRPVAKPTFVDDRPRFGLGKLDRLTDDMQIRLATLKLPALLVHLGSLAGISSVRVARAEKVMREAARQLKMLQDMESEHLKAFHEHKAEESVAAASASAAQDAMKDFVLPADAPVAPPLHQDVVFGSQKFGGQKPATYWAKGTGYGHSGAQGDFDIDAYLRKQELSQQELRFVMRQVSDRLEARAPVDEAGGVAELAETALVPVLESYLANDSGAEILEQQSALYADLFSLLAHILAMDAPNPSRLLPLLQPKVAPLLRKIARAAAAVEALDVDLPSGASPSASASSSKAALSAAASATITSFVIELSAILDQALQQQAEQASKAAVASAEPVATPAASPAIADAATSASASASASASPAPAAAPADRNELLQTYCAALSPMKFGEVSSFPAGHKYEKQGAKGSSAPISRAFTRRLAVEYADLSSSLPTHLDSSVWLRVHESTMQYAQLMISGPEGTPYAGGLFLFDVFFPPQYPAEPPQVNLCTTGKGSVRFNPNLYACGKVCLSILGTWGGGVGEGWSAKSSTMLQVAVSIQSLVFVAEPYFNEPSYESSMHTPAGKSQSEAYSRPLLAATVRWAMIDQMRHPPAGFERIVAAHFTLKRDEIKRQVDEWAKKNPDGLNAEVIKELHELLDQQTLPKPEADE